MYYKEFLSAIAIILTLVAYVPYIWSIRQGKTKPHIFSWFLWGSTTFIVFLAQLAAKGGVGAWPLGVSGIITLYVAYLAYLKKADSTITPLDWVFFISGFCALPVWYVTANPVWAVILLTLIDCLAFGPTFRKAYYHPFDESLIFFVIMAFRNIFAALALEYYSLTTLLFPSAMAIACLLFIIMVWVRRRSTLM